MRSVVEVVGGEGLSPINGESNPPDQKTKASASVDAEVKRQ